MAEQALLPRNRMQSNKAQQWLPAKGCALLHKVTPLAFSLTASQLHDNAAAAAKSRQLCPTLCDPIDCSPPGSPVPGILQARTLEWVAISFSNA